MKEMRTSSLRNRILSNQREVLAANRTYYVSQSGSNKANGLSLSAAFATPQFAVDTVASLDLSIYDVDIRIAPGTWTTPIVLKSLIGAGKVTIRGLNDDTNTIISTTAASAIGGLWDGTYCIRYLKLQTATSGSCLNVQGSLEFNNINFGISPEAHIVLSSGRGYVLVTGNYSISGSAAFHVASLRSALFFCNARTITLTGTPAFGQAFLWSSYSGTTMCWGNTYSGSATGPRWLANLNGVVFSATDTLPGSVDGSVSTGGQKG
jgi:hypothetical protein